MRESVTDVRGISLPWLSRARVACLLVLAIALIVGAISLPAERFIIGGDSPWPELNPNAALAQRTTGWADNAALGRDSSFFLPIVPIAAFDYLLKSAGASPLAINHIWMMFLIVLQAMAAVRLFFELFPNGRQQIAAVVFVGCAAILNPYVLLFFHTPNPALNLGVAVAPGMLASMLAFLRLGRARFLVEYFVWACIASPVNVNPAFVMEQVGLMVGAACFAFVRAPGGRLRMLPRLCEIALVYVGVNIALWIPIVHYINAAFGQFSRDAQVYSADTLRVSSQFSQLQNAVRLVGGYLFFNPVGETLYIPDGPSYVNNPFIVIATLGLPTLALSCWWLCRRSDARFAAMTLTGFALILLFFSKGTSPPFGGIFSWLFVHVPAFQGFRDSYGKFAWMLLICYALLAGQTLVMIGTWPRRFAAPTITAAFVLLAVAAYPILGGRLFYDRVKVAPPARYAQLAHWIESQDPGSRFMQLPVQSDIFVAYNWGFLGAGFNENLTDRSIVAREYDFGQPGTLALDNVAKDFDLSVGKSRFAGLLGLYGVTHIIQDSSMSRESFASFSAPDLIKDIRNTHHVAKFGSIDVYDVNRRVLNDRVYAATRLFAGATSLRDVAAACSITSCRGAAFIGEATSATFGYHVPDRFDFLGSTPHHGPHERVFRRQPFRLEISDVGAREPLGPASAVDYANTTLSASDAPEPAITPFEVSGASPVAIGISSKPSAGFEPLFAFKSFDSIPHGASVCSLPLSTASRFIRISSLPGGTNSTLVLLLRYTSDASNAWIYVAGTGDGAGAFLIPLAAGRNVALVRLFRLPERGKGIFATIGVGSLQRRGCLTVESLLVGVARRPHAWTLAGNEANLSVTAPYIAARSSILVSRIDEPYTAGAVTKALTAGPVTRWTAPWSLPEVISGSPTDVRASGIPNGVVLRALNALADVHAQIEHILPGVSYDLHIPIRGFSGSQPRITVLSQNGEVLSDEFLPEGNGGDVVLAIDNPLKSGNLRVYVYTGSAATGRSSVTLGTPYAVLTGGTNPVTWTPGSSFATPALLQAARVNGATYDVRVTDAPPQYLLVLNTSFSPGWKVVAQPGIQAKHIVANLYTNGWVISGRGSYRLVIAYDGAEYVRRGILLAVLCLLAAAVMHLASNSFLKTKGAGN